MIKTVKIKAILSLILALLFVVVLISGIVLHKAPNGKTVKKTGWTFLGINKSTLNKIHIITGYLMSVLLIFHLLLNKNSLFNEIKTLLRRNK